MSGLRCFVGLPLPTDVSGILADTCEVIRREAPAWRGEKWVAPQNLHVTIAFIGSVDEGAMGFLAEEVGAVVAAARPFELPFAGIQAIPGLHRCRMLWASFADPRGLCAELAARVVEASVPFGAERSERAFTAHVTLVRARKPRSLPAGVLEAALRSSEVLLSPMSVPRATLFSSTLTPKGPVYSEVGSWSLSGA